MHIFENELHCVLSYVVMENIIFPSVPRLLGYFPVSDVGFFIVMIECAFVSLLFIYSGTYYINGLTVNVYVPSYFNDVKRW
jgi:hypothetical protein